MTYRSLAIIAGACFLAGVILAGAVAYAVRPKPAAPGPDLRPVVAELQAQRNAAQAQADFWQADADVKLHALQEARRRAERVFPPLPVPETAVEGAAALQGIGIVASPESCGLVLDLRGVPVIQGLHREAGRIPDFQAALAAAEGRGDSLEKALGARDKVVDAMVAELKVGEAAVQGERAGREKAEIEVKSLKRWGPVKVGVGVAVGAGAAWGLSRLVK